VTRLGEGLRESLNPALRAQIDSVAHIAQHTDLVPIGMTIGPFSLMTKLLKDPITPIYMAGSGMTADDDPDVARLERALELSLQIVLYSVEAQIRAGAKAIFMAETGGQRRVRLAEADRGGVRRLPAIRHRRRPPREGCVGSARRGFHLPLLRRT